MKKHYGNRYRRRDDWEFETDTFFECGIKGYFDYRVDLENESKLIHHFINVCSLYK